MNDVHTMCPWTGTYLSPKHCVNNANYTVKHDIFSLSTIEFLIAPEYRRNWTFTYSIVRQLIPVLKFMTYLDPPAQWFPAECSRTRPCVALVSQ